MTTAGTTDRAIGSATAHLAATTIGAIAVGGSAVVGPTPPRRRDEAATPHGNTASS